MVLADLQGKADKSGLPMADSGDLRQALAEANLPTLMAAYVQLSCDEAMLERFSPHIRPMFAMEPTAIPDALAKELRDKLHRLLTTGEGLSAVPPSDALVQRIMSVMAGEPVADEFIALAYDQCGFKPWIDRSAVPGRKQPPRRFQGAGDRRRPDRHGCIDQTHRGGLRPCRDREEPRSRRHLVRKPLSRRGGRYPEPFLQL